MFFYLFGIDAEYEYYFKNLPLQYQGKRISIAEYIWEKYKIKLTDKEQPLLISNPNAKMRRSGITQPISLVPE